MECRPACEYICCHYLLIHGNYPSLSLQRTYNTIMLVRNAPHGERSASNLFDDHLSLRKFKRKFYRTYIRVSRSRFAVIIFRIFPVYLMWRAIRLWYFVYENTFHLVSEYIRVVTVGKFSFNSMYVYSLLIFGWNCQLRSRFVSSMSLVHFAFSPPIYTHYLYSTRLLNSAKLIV